MYLIGGAGKCRCPRLSGRGGIETRECRRTDMEPRGMGELPHIRRRHDPNLAAFDASLTGPRRSVQVKPHLRFWVSTSRSSWTRASVGHSPSLPLTATPQASAPVSAEISPPWPATSPTSSRQPDHVPRTPPWTQWPCAHGFAIRTDDGRLLIYR